VIQKFSPEIDPKKVKDYIIENIKERSYHKQFVATTRRYFQYVLKINLDLSDLPYPRKEEKIPVVLSVDEMKRLIQQPKNLKHQLIICLFYNCGLRMGELLYLMPENIDRSRMEVNIKFAKGNKSRNIPIDQKLINLIDAYVKEYKPEKYLFNGQFGGLYTERSINQFLKYWAKKASISKNVHAHMLRHSYATHLHESGIELAVIQELLGHNDIKTTDIYTKTSQARKRVPSLLNGIDI
jgi:site-specific recombinase XerD